MDPNGKITRKAEGVMAFEDARDDTFTGEFKPPTRVRSSSYTGIQNSFSS